MNLLDDGRTQDRESEKRENSNGKVLLILAVVLLPIYFLVTHVAGRNIGLTSTLCLAMNLVAIGICWDLRRRVWFWAVAMSVLALHIRLILLIHWPHYWIPGIALVPIGFVDVLITVGIIRFVQKFIVREDPPDERE